jgi:CHASE1-domain containing sensor protein/predicted Ser/Thr protein kinase
MTGTVNTAVTTQEPAAPPGEADTALPRIGRYTLLRTLGRGGMGVVHLALDEVLGRSVAVKLLDQRGTPALQARLLQEAQSLARLSHPNVVAIYEAGEHDGRIYLAMERITGETLRVWRSERPRALAEVLDVALQAARGLAAAHDAGLVHRDVKPDNIMIGDDGRVRVMDFGLARATRSRALDETHASPLAPPSSSSSPALTALGTVVGTPGYMAPEQRRGAIVDASSDMYSFCVVLCELLTGARPPADRADLSATLTRRRAPRWLAALVHRGLHPDPAARWPSMHAVIAQLEAALRPEVRRTRVRVLTAASLLAVSVVAAWQAHVVIAQHQQTRFTEEVHKIESAIQQRMTAYVQVLRGGLGLFVVTGVGDLDRWLRYVATLQLGERYPGFKSLSFAVATAPEDLPALIRRVRTGPLPPGIHDPRFIREFAVRSPVAATSAPPIHSPIIFVAPMIRENERVLGVDMMQEPARRAAMERAARTDAAVLSPRVNLAGQGDLKAGFIAYLAVRRDGAVEGWLTAAFLADDFMRGLLGDGPPALEFEVHDGETPTPETLLYSTAGVQSTGQPTPLTDDIAPALDHVGQLALPGRTWTLRCRTTPEFSPLTDRLAPWLIVLSGLFASVLFHVMSRASSRFKSVVPR